MHRSELTNLSRQRCTVSDAVQFICQNMFGKLRSSKTNAKYIDFEII